MSNYLILVRHSLPEILPGIPASSWRLSPEGERRCLLLAQRITAYHPGVVVSSHEIKAVETARWVADRVRQPVQILDGLEEHHREKVAFSGQLDFKKRVKQFFEHPGELVFGSETALQAEERFSKTLSTVIDHNPSKSLVVVTHGTVISLFIWRRIGVEPYQFWQNLGMPAYVLLPLPELDEILMVENEPGLNKT